MNTLRFTFHALAAGLLTHTGLLAATGPDQASLIPEEEGSFIDYRSGDKPRAPWNVVEVAAPSRVQVMREAQSPFPPRTSTDTGEAPAGIVWEDVDSTSWGPMLTRRYASLEAHHGKILWAFDYLVHLDSTESGPIVFLSNGVGSADRAGPTLFLCQQPGRLLANDGPHVTDLGPAELGTWHRVEIVIDLERKVYDLTLQRWNGKPLVLGRELAFRSADPLPLRYLTIGDESRDKISGGSLFIDNILLVPLPPAPQAK